MDENDSANGSNGKVYVKFGPRPNQEMPVEWAEYVLARLAETHASMFGKLLAEAALGGK